jgi:hypothetical protein
MSRSTENLNDENETQKTGIINWWNKKGNTNKLLTGLGACCIGIILFLVAIILLFPTTSLSVEPTEVQIDNNTTEYTIYGTADPKAIVKITAPVLNLKDKTIKVNSNGSFSYKITIPLNVNETDVNITAKSLEKSQNGVKITIKRDQPTPKSASTSNLPEYTLSNLKFQLSNDWTETSDVKEENMVKFFYGNDLSLIVQQFSDQKDYNSDYKTTKSNTAYPVTTTTKKIDGINVKVVETTLNIDSGIIESYYFQIGNNYYGIFFEDYRNSKDSVIIEEALNSVIKTLHN